MPPRPNSAPLAPWIARTGRGLKRQPPAAVREHPGPEIHRFPGSTTRAAVDSLFQCESLDLGVDVNVVLFSIACGILW